MRILDKIIGYLSIIIGMILSWYHFSTYIDYILHPDLLRLFWYPKQFLIIQTLIGLSLIVAGVAVLINNLIYYKIYLCVGYFYLIAGISDTWSRLTPGFLIIYVIVSIIVISYFNFRQIQLKFDKKKVLWMNLKMFLLSMIAYVILHVSMIL
jgi:hypothetical protein